LIDVDKLPWRPSEVVILSNKRPCGVQRIDVAQDLPCLLELLTREHLLPRIMKLTARRVSIMLRGIRPFRSSRAMALTSP
jgi:hypothetical protein